MAKPSVYGKQSVQFKSAHENRWHDRQMEHTQVRPKKRNYMDLRVEMIPLIALIARPGAASAASLWI
jgi:hypothetical protein